MKVFMKQVKETAGEDEAAEVMALVMKLSPKLMMVMAQAEAKANAPQESAFHMRVAMAAVHVLACRYAQ